MLDEEPAVKRAKVDTSSRNPPDSPGMRPQPGTPSCGAPRYQPESGTFTTEGGVSIVRSVRSLSRAEFAAEKSALVLALDNRRGCIFESAYEYPGRYQHWTMGFVDPPIAIAGRGRAFDVTALNARGRVLIGVIGAALRSCAAVECMSTAEDGTKIVGNVRTPAVRFSEEERSKQPSIFSVVRAIRALFAVGPEVDPQLGLYGSFGYDLTFQFEPVKRNHARDATARDLLLYLPDSIVVSDGTRAQLAWKIDYDFVVTSPPPGSSTTTTITLPRVGASTPFRGVTDGLPRRRDHAPGLYAKKVEKAREQFRIGNLFETVLSQVFYEPCAAPPSEIFDRLRVRNPSPYMFIINLGEEEHLVGASPEMFVRRRRSPCMPCSRVSLCASLCFAHARPLLRFTRTLPRWVSAMLPFCSLLSLSLSTPPTPLSRCAAKRRTRMRAETCVSRRAPSVAPSAAAQQRSKMRSVSRRS